VQDGLGHVNIQNKVIYGSFVLTTLEHKAREHFFSCRSFETKNNKIDRSFWEISF
jgi:hypothetical protein